MRRAPEMCVSPSSYKYTSKSIPRGISLFASSSHLRIHPSIVPSAKLHCRPCLLVSLLPSSLLVSVELPSILSIHIRVARKSNFFGVSFRSFALADAHNRLPKALLPVCRSPPFCTFLFFFLFFFFNVNIRPAFRLETQYYSILRRLLHHQNETHSG